MTRIIDSTANASAGSKFLGVGNTFPHVIYNSSAESTKASESPYLSALPPALSDAQLRHALTRLPDFSPKQRLLPNESRIELLATLQTTYLPCAAHLRAAKAMLAALRRVYRRRQPFTTEEMSSIARLRCLKEGPFPSRTRQPRDPTLRLAFAGPAGCGKTATARSVAALVPPAIFHIELGRWQVPFLFIEWPFGGGAPGQLAMTILRALDELVPGAALESRLVHRANVTGPARLAEALSCAYKLGVGMVVLDALDEDDIAHELNGREYHHVARNAAATQYRRRHLLQHFAGALDSCGIGLVTIETRRRKRRSTTPQAEVSTRTEHIPLLKHRPSRTQHRTEFHDFVTTLWRYQWTLKRTQLTRTLQDALWRLSGGVPDILVKLFESAQETAIATGAELLSVRLLEKVFFDEFALLPTSPGALSRAHTPARLE